MILNTLKILAVSIFLLSSAIQLNTANSKLTVTGTSSLHDWEILVKDYRIEGQWNGSSLQDLKVAVVSKSLDSDNSVMNGKTHDALEVKKYSTITFSAKELSAKNGVLSGTGTVRVVGKSKSISVNLPYKIEGGKLLKLSGKVPLKMSDFGISPPTAMFGTLKTGDAVEVVLDLQFSI